MGIEDIIYFAVEKDSTPVEEIVRPEVVEPGFRVSQPIFYNLKKIPCPFSGGKDTGSNYGDITELPADWYRANTKYNQFTALAELSLYYGNRLLFFGTGFLGCDRENFPRYVQAGVEAERQHFERLKPKPNQ